MPPGLSQFLMQMMTVWAWQGAVCEIVQFQLTGSTAAPTPAASWSLERCLRVSRWRLILLDFRFIVRLRGKVLRASGPEPSAFPGSPSDRNDCGECFPSRPPTELAGPTDPLRTSLDCSMIIMASGDAQGEPSSSKPRNQAQGGAAALARMPKPHEPCKRRRKTS